MTKIIMAALIVLVAISVVGLSSVYADVMAFKNSHGIGTSIILNTVDDRVIITWSSPTEFDKVAVADLRQISSLSFEHTRGFTADVTDRTFNYLNGKCIIVNEWFDSDGIKDGIKMVCE